MFSWPPWPWRRGLKQGYLDRVVERILSLPTDGSLEDKQFCLNEREIARICKSARDAFLQEPALLELPRFEGETVLVGDLHGQFKDLQNILSEVGRPSLGRRYIFLGDYVDRGECGLEIVIFLFALKLRYPDRVYLLRGNHECTEITVMFGFCMECQRRSTLTAWEAVMQVFDALPLAAVLQQHVLCVHGGISPQLTSLSEINSIARPTDVNPSGAGLLVDLLWADPCTHTPGWCHSPRGVSYCFGLSAAREFMARTGVRSIVRAHMVQAQGFEVLGNHEVITVFSAVNYRGSGNTGAVLILDADCNMHFRTFLAPLRPTASPSSVHNGVGPSLPVGSPPDQEGVAAQQAQRSSSDEQEAGLRAACTCRGQSVGEFPGHAHAPPPELVALEEVAEDSRAVHHRLGGVAHGPAAAGTEWRYALPAAAAVTAADGAGQSGGTRPERACDP